MNLTKLREKLNHPVTQLVLIIALQFSSRWNARFPWLPLLRMALLLWLNYKLLGPLFRRKSSGASEPRGGFPWQPMAYILGVILIAFLWAFFRAGDTLTKSISPQPLQVVSVIDHPRVVLGSDEMTIYHLRGYEVGTISYYTADGRAVGMAHAVDGLELGGYWLGLSSDTDHQFARLTANNDNGIVLKLDHLPDKLGQAIEIGDPDDISVGEVAQLYSVRGGNFPVRVLGYIDRWGFQYLAIQPLDKQHAVVPGMSGSPIVQDGRLIGCVSASIRYFHRGPAISFARLAADIYAATSPPVTSP